MVLQHGQRNDERLLHNAGHTKAFQLQGVLVFEGNGFGFVKVDQFQPASFGQVRVSKRSEEISRSSPSTAVAYRNFRLGVGFAVTVNSFGCRDIRGDRRRGGICQVRLDDDKALLRQPRTGSNQIERSGYAAFVIEKFHLGDLAHKLLITLRLVFMNKIIWIWVLTVKNFRVNLSISGEEGGDLGARTVMPFCGDRYDRSQRTSAKFRAGRCC
ncbi:MAG TPA: hypothetical protein VMW24_12195 [Sedimentisphaerales bacterium]|nr:hypothetical protein [Sedimentisphaerales bacterium]